MRCTPYIIISNIELDYKKRNSPIADLQGHQWQHLKRNKLAQLLTSLYAHIVDPLKSCTVTFFYNLEQTSCGSFDLEKNQLITLYFHFGMTFKLFLLLRPNHQANHKAKLPCVHFSYQLAERLGCGLTFVCCLSGLSCLFGGQYGGTEACGRIQQVQLRTNFQFQ